VKEYFYAAPTGETLSHFTIVYVPADRTTRYRDIDQHWINECVAVDDRILMLFEANSDEVFVIDRVQPADPQPPRTILITWTPVADQVAHHPSLEMTSTLPNGRRFP
jgi:hypothetical protein